MPARQRNAVDSTMTGLVSNSRQLSIRHRCAAAAAVRRRAQDYDCITLTHVQFMTTDAISQLKTPDAARRGTPVLRLAAAVTMRNSVIGLLSVTNSLINFTVIASNFAVAAVGQI